MKPQAFTLIELLVVVLLLGLMLGIGGLQYGHWQARSLARQAAQQVMAELERTRSEAKRLNRLRGLYLAPGPNARSFQVRDAAGTTLRTIQLPRGVIMPAMRINNTPVTNPTTVAFEPPYGLVAGFAGPIAIQLRLQRDPQSISTVEVVSMLGKVILR